MNSDNETLNYVKIFFGITLSLIFVLLMKVGVFKDMYNFSASFFQDFQQENMSFFGQIKEDFDFINNLGNLKIQNDYLLAENSKLLAQNSSLLNLLSDNTLITKQLSFNSQVKYIPSRITKYKDNQTAVILNKGIDEGVKVNDVIVLENYLIGHVSEVYNSYAVGLLTIDAQSKMAIITQNSKLKGVGNGDGVSSIMVGQLPNDKQLEMSEIVLTAGTDGIYPFGLIIGKITKIDSQVIAVEQAAQVVPDIKMKDLREVFIIKND